MYWYIPRFIPIGRHRTEIWTDVPVHTEIYVNMPVQNRDLDRCIGTYRDLYQYAGTEARFGLMYRHIPRFIPICRYRTEICTEIWTDVSVHTEIYTNMPVQNRDLHRYLLKAM